MYKLLATSALVAAGLWGAMDSASAQQAKPGFPWATSPISVVVGGYHTQVFGYATNKDGVASAGSITTVANTKPNRTSQQSDSEIWFGGRTTLANGIAIGFDVQLEGNTSGDVIDESFMFLEGAFGRVELGTINTVAYRMDHGITFMPNRGYSAQESGVYGSWVINPTAVTFLDTTQGGKRAINGTAAPGGTATGTGEDQQKINYYTPRIGGIQVGATFLPNYQTEDAGGFADRSNARTNAYSFAINHVNNFSGVQLNGSASYTVYPKVKGAASSAAAGNDIKDMSIGGQLGAAGFLVGLGYRNVDAKNAAENGSVYGVGVNYTTGPMILHASYIKSKVDGGNLGANGDDTYEHWILSANYDIGPGVALIGSVFWAEFKDDATITANNNNKGAGALAGISLMF